jgi:hypothetical protein
MKPDKTLFPAIQNKDWLFSALIVAIIGMGLILRTAKYLPAWSMRGDELAVALNLINRSAIDLITRPLDGDQAAPIGFLLVEKLLLVLFGKSEYILRLPAFVAGCASLILLQKLLSKTVGKYGNLFAMAASAFSWYLIYYSSELKQYSSDVLVCIILLLFFQKHLSKKNDQERFHWTRHCRCSVHFLFAPRAFCRDGNRNDFIHPLLEGQTKTYLDRHYWARLEQRLFDNLLNPAPISDLQRISHHILEKSAFVHADAALGGYFMVSKSTGWIIICCWWVIFHIDICRHNLYFRAVDVSFRKKVAMGMRSHPSHRD